ncbi:MAG: L-arabinose ABC transporter ATP-binding protein AraG [Opitutaceae bacterium]|nr:L-arabinose ABC transporter ATP-binding protein AraG [Opitutaceae bacterium]
MPDPTSAPVLGFDGLTMEFPGVRALDAVSFGVRAGSVHALMGENGAGKSTLLKILSGAYQPTAGHLQLQGVRTIFPSTAAAIAAGVAVIYQELHLVPEMTVAENLLLGRYPRRGAWLDRAALRAEAARLLQLVGEDINPGTRLGRLPLAQRQMVEIAKALGRGARLVAFDEPTSSLSETETRRLFAIIRDLRDRGHAILYVTHRMDEVFEICDAATVLRDGRHVVTHGTLADVTRDTLVRSMVGRELTNIYNYQPRPHVPNGLEVRNLEGPGLRQPVSFSVARGEIAGFFGLVGAGRTELMRLLCGAVSPTAGKVMVHGTAVQGGSPRAAIRDGIVFCPEDRKKEGIIAVRSVAENINLSARRNHLRGGLLLDSAWERTNATAQITRLGVRTASSATPIGLLSGGNQQKAILARWLSEPVRVVVLDEPTRGIDIGAKSEIYALIRELATAGASVVIVSSELPEVLGIADRIFVMREGALAAEFTREQATPEAVLHAALPSAAA